MKPARDEVDRIVAEWRQERPDLDVSALEVLSRVTRLARHLDRARKSAFAKHNLETWSFDVLAGLRRAGAPYELSPGQLLQETLVTSGTMTNRIDRLQELGLVERRPEPNDGRGILVSLTPAGKTLVDDALDDLLASEENLLSNLLKEERIQLAEMLCTVLTPFDSADQPST
ncbi:MAG TPA: MarR family transcriptional regulator [Candidatus Nanopelagicaceae bacterium]|nr:MarR family transcriptional regulator [Candidatus Nanopelagicaceae bacterium]